MCMDERGEVMWVSKSGNGEEKRVVDNNQECVRTKGRYIYSHGSFQLQSATGDLMM